MSLERDPAEERAGIVSRSGDIATMGDGTHPWLNATQWARDEADAAIAASPYASRIHQAYVYHRA